MAIYYFYKNLGQPNAEMSHGEEHSSLPTDLGDWDGVWTEAGKNAYIAANSQSYTYSPYKLTGDYKDPRNINYDIYGLHKKRTLNQGELSLVEYYRNFDGVSYSDLVLKEERIYTRNPINLAMYRTQITTWYLENGEIGCTKETTKFYSPTESVAESETRRSNLVADAQLYCVNQIGLENSLDFMESVSKEIMLYVKGGIQYLFDAINTSTKPYLTSEIKATLIYILTII